ncbi:MAG: hypothetical protein M3N16_01360 [Actinomycetota bacterium]|nr:hypothetical protein [Actinomycetota bacterium]
MGRRCLLGLAAAACLALGACGDDRLSRPEYVSRANALCRENERRIAEVAQDVVGKGRRSRGRRRQEEIRNEVLRRSLPITRSMLGRLRALRPPEEDEARVTRFLDQIEEAADLLSQVERAARERDRARVGELTTRIVAVAGPSRRFAQDYGLRDCLPEAGSA